MSKHHGGSFWSPPKRSGDEIFRWRSRYSAPMRRQLWVPVSGQPFFPTGNSEYLGISWICSSTDVHPMFLYFFDDPSISWCPILECFSSLSVIWIEMSVISGCGSSTRKRPYVDQRWVVPWRGFGEEFRGVSINRESPSSLDGLYMFIKENPSIVVPWMVSAWKSHELGVSAKWGYPKKWLVFVRDNPTPKSMTGGTPLDWRPPCLMRSPFDTRPSTNVSFFVCENLMIMDKPTEWESLSCWSILW